MTRVHEETENDGPTPRDEDWMAENDPTYDDKTAEGGVWYDLSDDKIVLLQIEEFNWDEHERKHQQLDDSDDSTGDE